MSVPTLQTLAEEVRAGFTLDKRTDGSEYWTRRDKSERWITDLCHEAHGDMMPDDVRYEYIVDALDIIAEHGDDADAAESLDSNVDIYNSDRTAWLASHNGRQEYADRAVSDGLCDGADIMQTLGCAQYLEREEVYGSVLASLQAQLEEVEA
jgi:hypothetical protein